LPAPAGWTPGLLAELDGYAAAIANWGRHIGADAEGALRAANLKFERRFASMEALARARALTLNSLSLDQWEALWCEAKLAERGAP